jgi:hypothetical protein
MPQCQPQVRTHLCLRHILSLLTRTRVCVTNVGYQVVRNQIKSFAMNKCTLPPGRYVVLYLAEFGAQGIESDGDAHFCARLYTRTPRLSRCEHCGC